jgi:hypothetical protein
LYGAASNEQIRSFGIYYSIVVVPFLVIAAGIGALAIARHLPIAPGRQRFVAAGVVLGSALLVGSSNAGYSLRPWRAEVASVTDALSPYSRERILVQSGLYPHAGYDARIELLTPEAVADPRRAGSLVLLGTSVGTYPFSNEEIARLRQLPAVATSADSGLRLVRLPLRQ